MPTQPPATIKRRLPLVLIALLVLLSAFATTLSNAHAATAAGQVYTVMNTSEVAPDGVYFRNSPHTGDTRRITGLGVYKNEQVSVDCYAGGDAVAPYGNTTWEYARNLTRPIVNGQPNQGWLNSHYVNDGQSANHAPPGLSVCGAPPAPPVAVVAVAVKRPTVINGRNVGYPSNNPHAWGACTVQDFNGGPDKWVIVSYTGGTHIVRNGMLFGWFDNNGGPGQLGCPTSDETPYQNGQRQSFQHGALIWIPGMNHAALADARTEAALGWAWTHLNTNFWNGKCLQFVAYSYINGAATTLHNGPYGPDVPAVAWWNQSKSKHAHDTYPPRGSLVFWDTYANGIGHAALSLGGGLAISTGFGSGSDATNVHVFAIASAPAHYLGWVDIQP